MPNFQDFFFDSSTGVNRIHARKCLPDTAPKAVVQIAHGIAEYIDRYDEFMSFLAEHGYVAVGNDHLGHGKSIRTPQEQGFFAESEGWDRVVEDMDRLRALMRQEYPDLPTIFFGHSMGSFLTRTYIIRYPGKADAVVLSGTGHQGKALVLAGCAMSEAAVKLYGPRKIGQTLNNICFGAYNKGFDQPRTAFDWLNRDEAEVDKYVADPLCGFVATVSLFRDMMGGIRFITDQKNIDRMNKDAPVLFISGGSDPVGENGRGVERAYEAFCRAGVKDVSMRLYPGGRHEVLKELNKDQVFSDVLTWLESKLPNL